MIKFVNSKIVQSYSPTITLKHGRRYSLEEFQDLVKDKKEQVIVISNILENFSITNKGGKRLINIIYNLINSVPESNQLVIQYDAMMIKSYILNGKVNWLYQSYLSTSSLISMLENTSIEEFQYSPVDKICMDIKFKNSSELLQYVANKLPEDYVVMFDQVEEFLKDPYKLPKDLREFSTEIPAAYTIAQNLLINVKDIINAVIEIKEK